MSLPLRFTVLQWFYSAAEAGGRWSVCSLTCVGVCTRSSVHLYMHMHVPGHVCMCVCRPFSILLGSLICFGSVWWAGQEANYLLKGKSEPNEPHWATEVAGLIKHSVCITGYLTQDPTVHRIVSGLQRCSFHTTHMLHDTQTHQHWRTGPRDEHKFFFIKADLIKDWMRLFLFSECSCSRILMRSSGLISTHTTTGMEHFIKL